MVWRCGKRREREGGKREGGRMEGTEGEREGGRQRGRSECISKINHSTPEDLAG